MKRIVVSLLVLAMALSLLSACGGKPEDVSGKIEPNTAQPSTPAGSIETVAPEETQSPNVSLGRIEGGVYTNTYAGFGCVLDSNWEFYTAEELQELPENVQELLSDTEVGDALNASTQIMDMQAENLNDLTTINVGYQKLDAAARLMSATMSEEEIIDSTLEQKDVLISSYAQAGIDVASMEKVEVEFLGEKHFALYTKASVGDIPYYIVQLMDYHAGRYAVTTTFGSYVEDKTDSLLELFYAVD